MTVSDQKLDLLLAELRELRKEVNATLHGTAPDHSKGLVMRVDRLEQRMGILAKLWWIVAGAVATSCAKLFIWK